MDATDEVAERIPNKAKDLHIALIGIGTIGLSFAAFHLTHLQHPSQLTIYDPRPDLEDYVKENLPQFFPSKTNMESNSKIHIPDISSITISPNLPTAVQTAHIIQESGPENAPFKQALWAEVEKHAPKYAVLWSSTSGIPASTQSARMQDKSRVLVVHPYNQPHIMPLLEFVPSPQTSKAVVSWTQAFWIARGRVPILIEKEVTGFVANRLAFALLREEIHLVDEGVVGVAEVDAIVESSMGPRWAVAGPFKSYAAGGGEGGLESFFKNIGGTVQDCWSDSGRVDIGGEWEEKVFRQAKEAYGVVNIGERDSVTRRVLEALRDERKKN